MQNFRPLRQPPFWEKSRELGEKGRQKEKIMPSIMATSLRWRTHSAGTNCFVSQKYNPKREKKSITQYPMVLLPQASYYAAILQAWLQEIGCLHFMSIAGQEQFLAWGLGSGSALKVNNFKNESQVNHYYSYLGPYLYQKARSVSLCVCICLCFQDEAPIV